ncbi:hypothetical protein PsorP6_017649 [Peronosclerospora sorghi]|uniref:Uncharacterized protein n=1 Tax=Peronosclerospora sorghi TaxID=230839 RepID=A0ACC0WMU4_9STRA|nr:hypothetical protein PsorP6_017649 [Peronosclerospora sorghi]
MAPERALRARKPRASSVSPARRPAHDVSRSSDAPAARPRPRPTYTNTFRAQKVDGLLLFPEQPRQIVVLLVVVVGLSYYSFTHDATDAATNVRSAFFAATLVFLVYCFLQTKDGLMVRPHPGVWRVVHGCSVVYLLTLAALLVQNRRGAMHAMHFLFPEVGSRPKAAQNAPLECAINTQSVTRGVTSIWFVAHVTGWWGKMCMFRDWRFCWVLSIAFEVLELALQFVIPDFQECWWDSLLLDVLGANLLGMCLGRWTLWLLESKEYDWSGRRGRNKLGYVRLALSQFTPFRWEQYHWEVFSSFKRFAEILFAMIMCLVTEVNAFFMLTTLSLPKESRFNSYRLLLLFLLGIPAAAEYYEFITNPACGRFGQNSWMILAVATFEMLVWLKFSADGALFTHAPPAIVVYPILAFVGLFSVWTVLFFVCRPGVHKHDGTAWAALDVLFWVSFTPLLLLTSQWAF